VFHRFLPLALGLVLFSLSAVPASAQVASLYVSPQGSDANPGTISQPFATLTKARDAVRTINQNMTGDITVYLRSGTYFLSGPLLLGPQDSGTNNFKVIYKNYTGERPIVSGGKIIIGWIQEGNKWKANVGTLNTRQLYVNGVRATRARSAGGIPGGTRTSNGYNTTDTTMQNWGNQGNIEMVGENQPWSQSRCQVQSISANFITMKPECWGSGFPSSWIENAYELLDQPSEWYFNRSTGWLYYMPRTGENMTTISVVAPVLEALIQGNGTVSSPIQNLQFEGLTFAHTTWLRPNTALGFTEAQANSYIQQELPGGPWKKVPGGLYFTYAQNIRFERNILANLGGAGITLDFGSKNNIISGNHFFDIASNAINLGDLANPQTTDTREIPQNNQITNNYIHKIAADYNGGVAIWAGYVDSLTIAHNEIHDLPYSAISLGWGWGTADPTIAKNNLVTNNLIYDHVKVLRDGGGIYTQSAQPGTQILNNVVRNQVRDQGGLYADNHSRYITWSNNVSVSNPYSVLLNNTQEVTVTGNYLQGNIWVYNPWGTNITSPNTQITSLSQVPSSIVGNAGIEAAYQNIKTFTPIIPTPPPLPGDLTGDGQVNLLDLLAAISSLNIFTFNQVVANFGK